MDQLFSRSGFYKSTITKCSLVSIATISAFGQFSAGTTRTLFKYDIAGIINKLEFSHLILAKLAFLDPSDFVFGCMVIYHFRFFERRFGSRKYLSSIIWMFILSTAFELLSGAVFSMYGITLSALPSGPFFLIYPFCVHYFNDVPNLCVMNSYVLPLSRKLLLCFLGLRLAMSSVGSLVVFGCGLITGLIYRFTFIQNVNLIPSSVAGAFSRILGPIFSSKGPKMNHITIGATLELQRQEALDRQEQMLMDFRRNQIRNFYLCRDYFSEPHEIQSLMEVGFSEE